VAHVPRKVTILIWIRIQEFSEGILTQWQWLRLLITGSVSLKIRSLVDQVLSELKAALVEVEVCALQVVSFYVSNASTT